MVGGGSATCRNVGPRPSFLPPSLPTLCLCGPVQPDRFGVSYAERAFVGLTSIHPASFNQNDTSQVRGPTFVDRADWLTHCKYLYFKN